MRHRSTCSTSAAVRLGASPSGRAVRARRASARTAARSCSSARPIPAPSLRTTTARPPPTRKARKYNARAYDSFPIRHWDRWLDELRPSLLVQPLDGSTPARDLLAGSALRNERGFGGRLGNEGDTLEATWTPDGAGVVFAATTNRHEAARAEVISSLWHVRLAGGEPRRLTGDEGDYSTPEFTPDGKTLLAKQQPATDRWVYTADRLVRWSWPSLGDSQVVTRDFDEAVGQYVPAPDSRRVFFLAERAGHDQLFEVPVAGGKPREVGKLEAGTYSRIAVGGTGKAPVVAAVWSSAVRPHELGRVDLRTGQWRSITTFNTERAAGIDWLPAEEFWFTSSRGKRIHSLLVKPPGFDPQRKYPLFVVIHGGPHSMWKDDFIVRWNYHLLAQPGYVVLLTNYSGSTGFGEAFARSIQGDPLEGPANEVNEAADEAIKRYPFIDGSRQAAGGASYGGHLANWLAVSTDRYQGAGEPRGPLRPAQPVDHQRRGVQPRAQHRRPGVGVDPAVARAEPVLPLGEAQDADPAHLRREGLPRAAQQRARVLDGAAAAGRAEPAGGVPRREPLGAEGREQPLLLPGSARLAGEVPVDRRGRLLCVPAAGTLH